MKTGNTTSTSDASLKWFKPITNGLLALAISLFATYLTFYLLAAQSEPWGLSIDSEVACNIAEEIKVFGLAIFQFLRPFLVLGLLMFIADRVLSWLDIPYKALIKDFIASRQSTSTK
ncbi:MAG: hypothetical protein KI790_05790 [Cyclobacteriaceae bacterium]|nr:hypothetical protein [Cyclobacteriaceae bacterium HetDA_MAG_MS6]